LEAFLNDFSIIFQNGGLKGDGYPCQNPFPRRAIGGQIPRVAPPPPHPGANH